jgi:hypothetical protein
MHYAARSLGELGFLGGDTEFSTDEDAARYDGGGASAGSVWGTIASGLLDVAKTTAPSLIDAYARPKVGDNTADLLKAIAGGHPVVATTDPRPAMVTAVAPPPAAPTGLLDRAWAFVQTPFGIAVAAGAAYVGYRAFAGRRRR